MENKCAVTFSGQWEFWPFQFLALHAANYIEAVSPDPSISTPKKPASGQDSPVRMARLSGPSSMQL